MTYNWQQPDWPNFRYALSTLEPLLFAFAHKAGQISGMLSGLSDETRRDAEISVMVAEALKTSEIEGEYLSRKDVMSSIRNQIGTHEAENVADARATGIATLMLDVRNTFQAPLTERHLFEWHKALLPYGRVETGTWRTHAEPMQVVSSRFGSVTVHYEAPPSKMVPEEMRRFVAWFNETTPKGGDVKNAALRSAIAHLYFESIHPFEDGNGRIGRAIAEKALFQGLGRVSVLSISQAIEAKKSDYYEALKAAQRSNEITPWLHYFVTTLISAQDEAERQIAFLLKKAKFYDKFRGAIHERQHKAIERMLSAGPEGFLGGMSAKKYSAITGASKATATRDLQELLQLGAFLKEGMGRSTRYLLAI